MTRLRLVIASVLLAMTAAAAHGVTEKIPIPGDGAWDYLTVDAEARRLYVSHATKVDVIDLATKKVAGQIPNTNGVHGIAIAADLNRGFTSNGRDNTVTIFDRKTLAPIATVKTGQNPDAIIYEPVTKRVFTFNGRSADATVIDAATGNVAGTIPLGGKPEFPVTNGKGTIWVNIEDTSEVVRIDAKSMKVESRWKLAPCEEPSALAFDLKNMRLFAGCSNKLLTVMDANNGKVIATAPIGGGVDGAVFDPGARLVYTANGEGTVTVIRQDTPDRYTVVETVKTQPGARTITRDPKTGLVYLSVADYGPPPAGAQKGGRPVGLPGTFGVLVIGQ